MKKVRFVEIIVSVPYPSDTDEDSAKDDALTKVIAALDFKDVHALVKVNEGIRHASEFERVKDSFETETIESEG